MAYLSQLSPDILKLLTSDPNAKYTDPSGMVYYGNWSAPTQGNDENAALPAQFLGQLIGIPGLNAPDGSQMASYDANGNFAGYGTTGVQTDFMDRFAPIMAAGILGGGALAASGLGGAAAGASGAEGAGAAGGSGAFLGEGALSGVPAWDGALASAGTAGSAGATAAGSDIFGGNGMSTGFTDTGTAGGALDTGYAGSGALTGMDGAVSPTGGGAATTPTGGSLISGVPNSRLLGLGATALGALGGSQGTQSGGTATKSMDPRLDGAVYGAGGLVPSAQGLLTSQLPQAQAAGQQMMSVGSGLLGQTAPTTAQNPYLKSVMDDIQRRSQEMLGANNAAIQGNFVGSGGLGGSRQGIAQGTAAAKAADYMAGQGANLYANAYNGDMNRLLQGQTLGAGLLSQGLSTGWAPIQSAASVYQPFTGMGSTTENVNQGAGWQGALGGALGAAQLAKNFGWFGQPNSTSTTTTSGNSGSWWG
jgi:hypothetical protein